MPKQCQGRKRRRLRGAAAGALALWLAAAPAMAGPADLYYERSLMLAAHGRCALFSQAEAGALAAGAAQARGAALRAGVAEDRLRATRARAEARARATDCRSAELATAAGRVRQAFAGWARTARMTFPGERAPWVADRTGYRSATWRLSQTSGGAAPVVFGVAGGPSGQALAVVASFPDGRAPYAARIVVRDPSRAARPWLARPGVSPTPPRGVSRAFLASARAPAEDGLLPEGARAGLAFRFPAAAAEAIAALDPREQFLVEFVFPDERVRAHRLEVGDFAAARAFVGMGEL